MKIPISKRLLCCAGFVEPGARVADIGTDHGYLGIYLLKNGIARQVTACDLRPLPLRNAQENAERFGVGAQMEFLLSDGLERVAPERIDTVVCAGMGGDLIVRILEACAWIRDPGYRLVLQPQSAGQALRLWLAENGYENIICTQPFGCLPNHICGKGMMKPIKALCPDVNIVVIDYDPGASRVNQENRLKLMLANAGDRA